MIKIEIIGPEEIENILNKIGYFHLEFNYFCNETQTFWYEGYLDTDYRIQVKIIDSNTIEIWDCDYYVDNYVRAGIARKNDFNKWDVIEG